MKKKQKYKKPFRLSAIFLAIASVAGIALGAIIVNSPRNFLGPVITVGVTIIIGFLICAGVFYMYGLDAQKHYNDIELDDIQQDSADSKTKTYTIYENSEIFIPALKFKDYKKIRGYNFSPEGLYFIGTRYIDRKGSNEIFLWSNVRSIEIAENYDEMEERLVKDVIKITAVTNDGIEFVFGLPNEEKFLLPIKLFWNGDILGCDDECVEHTQ